MKNNKLTDILTELGLSENEAKVYLSSLALGSSTILKIAQGAELKRTTVYSVIEALKQKGLINIEVKGFKNLFVAENPEKLETILEERKERFKKSLPEFAALYNLRGGESFIKYYEGLEAIKNIYDNLLKDVKNGEDYLVVSDLKRWFTLDPKFFQNFLERRARLNVNIRMLLQDSDIAREHQKIEKNYNETIKFLPAETLLSTNLVIIPRRIVIHQLVPPMMAIVIENKSIIQMHREFFEIMWRTGL